MASGLTERDRAKADRQSALLQEAARLFAERGFTGVSLEDLGAAVGVSGPAVYRHFANKQALLGAILLRVSERLRDGGRRVTEAHDDPRAQLEALVEFHVDFALAEADVIRVQDRDLASLSEADRHRVRRLQREYVDGWVRVLSRVHPDRSEDELRVRALACFGLINSTPHSVKGVRTTPADSTVRRILAAMATSALTV
nr:TetR/AcrR family transcriptional regulator [Microbacterium lemovicicum]